jgi:hypothetical protein
MNHKQNLLVSTAIAAALAFAATGPSFAIGIVAGGPAQASAIVGDAAAQPGPLLLSPSRMVALRANVVTSDGVAIGTVAETATTDDGEMLLIVAVADGAIEGVSRIALRLSAVAARSSLVRANNNAGDGRNAFLSTQWTVVIQTDAADLRASLQAAAGGAPAPAAGGG